MKRASRTSFTSAEEILALRRVLDAAVSLLEDGRYERRVFQILTDLRSAVIVALTFKKPPRSRAARRAPRVGHTPELRELAEFVTERRDLLRSYGSHSHADAYDIVLGEIAEMARRAS